MEFLTGAPSFGSLIRRMDDNFNDAPRSYSTVEGEIIFLPPWDVTEAEYLFFEVEFLVVGDASSIHTYRVYQSSGAGAFEFFLGFTQASWNERFSPADALRFSKTLIARVTNSGSIQPSLRGVTTAGNGNIAFGNARMRAYTVRA